MNYDIRNTCGKRRGCFVTALPYDSQPESICAGVYGTRNDIQEILSSTYFVLDEELEKEGQVEKMAA